MPAAREILAEIQGATGPVGNRLISSPSDLRPEELRMPFGNEGLEEITGLALSGGGFRAALFHLGSLWRLNELGYLPKLDRISSVSGGSITSGLLAVRWGELGFANDIATQFLDQIVRPLRDFCARLVDGPAVGEGALLPWRDVSEVIEREYHTHLFGAATLQDLPERPRFIFNSTNFMTGDDFRFSKPYAGDYRIGMIPKPTFPVALAVTASSAFPPVLSPVARKVEAASFERWDGADLFDHVEYRQRLFLTDGGVYDNLGLETLEKRCKMLLVSDAGAPFVPDSDPGSAWHTQTLRAFDIATAQSRGLRKRRLIADYQSTPPVRRGAYWGIMTEIAGFQLADALPVSVESTRYLASIRTRLNPFSDAEQCRLINGGYALCDAAMRKYVVAGIPNQRARWPYPEYSLYRPISEGERVAGAEARSPEAP
jgi:NTE family protein